MKPINLEELMELYRKTTQGERKREDDAVIAIDDGKRKMVACEYWQWNDADFDIAIHNTFPAIVERLRVAEATLELMAGGLSFWNNDPVVEIMKKYEALALTGLRKEGIEIGTD